MTLSVWTVPAPTVAGEPETFAVTNLIDQDAIPPSFFGMTSYEPPAAPVARVSRREAMQVPAVKLCRDRIAGSLGTLPLVTVKPDLSIDRTSWLVQPEVAVPRSVTMTRTAEDLLFEGVAWWFVRRLDWTGRFPAEVVKLDARSVDVLADQRVHITGKANRGVAPEWPEDGELIRFDSPNDGLLTAGARAIRQYLLLAAAAQRHAEGIPPLDYFKSIDGNDPPDPDTVRTELLDPWARSRRTRSTGFVPGWVEYHGNQYDATKLQLAEQIQHAVLEIARLAGVDADELGVAVTSRTYANQFDRRKAFLDFTLGPYRAAIEGRLSMGDITPRGTTTRFELDEFLRSDPLARYQAIKVGLEVGAIDKAEVRASEGKPALVTPPAATAPPVLKDVSA